MSEPQLTGFVVTPTGVIMHAENHRRLVAQLKGSKAMLLTLEPATPVSEEQLLKQFTDGIELSPNWEAIAKAQAKLDEAWAKKAKP